MCENKEEKTIKKHTDFEEETIYDFNNNSFLVCPVFKDDSADTLGTVLIRLIETEK